MPSSIGKPKHTRAKFDYKKKITNKMKVNAIYIQNIQEADPQAKLSLLSRI